MTTLDLIRAGSIASLSDGTLCRWIGDAGWGMAPLTRLSEHGPLQHGETDLDYRLRPRIAHLKLLIEAGPTPTGELTHWQKRARLLALLRPTRQPLALRWTWPDGTQRQIDVHVADDLSFASQDRLGFNQSAVVTFRAPDPTFYDPQLQTFVYEIGGSDGGAWTISWAVPWGIGAATIDQSRALAYPGTWRSYPTITIVGPIASPTITNLTTGDSLSFPGITIPAGSTYTLDLRYGAKTVVDAGGTNHLSELSTTSDLATFAIEADPDAPGGVNTLRVTGSTATSATEIYIAWYVRYLGI